jgi:hypothetical protein
MPAVNAGSKRPLRHAAPLARPGSFVGQRLAVVILHDEAGFSSITVHGGRETAVAQGGSRYF